MPLRACGHCRHYFVAIEERADELLCPYCRRGTIPIDLRDQSHFLRLLGLTAQPRAAAQTAAALHGTRREELERSSYVDHPGGRTTIPGVDAHHRGVTEREGGPGERGRRRS